MTLSPVGIYKSYPKIRNILKRYLTNPYLQIIPIEKIEEISNYLYLHFSEVEVVDLSDKYEIKPLYGLYGNTYDGTKHFMFFL